MARQCHQRTPAARIGRRYRRYRFLGMLTALVVLGGGLYLGLTEGEWIICVVGAVFLLLSAGMIATDKPPALPSARPPDLTEVAETTGPNATTSAAHVASSPGLVTRATAQVARLRQREGEPDQREGSDQP